MIALQSGSILIYIGLLMMSGAFAAFAQSGDRGIDTNQIHRMPGKIISKREFTRPAGPLKLRGYELQQLTFSPPLNRGPGIDKGLRLIFRGGPFLASHIVWINDIAYPAVTWKTDELQVTLFGDQKLPDGASVAITTGSDTCHLDKRLQSESPVALAVPAGIREAQPREYPVKLKTIRMRNGEYAVRISVFTDHIFPVRNEILVVQVGRRDYPSTGAMGTGPNVISALIPVNDFWSMPEGAGVVIKWGFCAPGGKMYAHLHKAELDQ